MLPEVPADLSTLSDAELDELRVRCEEFTRSALEGEASDEALANVGRVADDYERITAETAARSESTDEGEPAPDRSEELASVAARVLGNDPAPEGDPAPTGDPAPEPTTAAISVLRAEGDRVVLSNGEVYDRTPAVTASAPVLVAGQTGLPPLVGTRVAERHVPAPIRATAEPIVAGAGLDVAQGGHLEDMAHVAKAFKRRRESFGYIPPSEDGGEKIIVASILSELPDARYLRSGDDIGNWAKVDAVTSPEAITAAGGLCAPVQPYYGIQSLAGAHRPVRDALVGFTADRGGIRFVPPPDFASTGAVARSVADGATTNASATVTSATAAFTAADVGAAISGTGIPAASIIVAVTNATTVTISANATATAAGVTITITRQGASVRITAAQDAAALGGTQAQIVAATKPCLTVTCPGITEVQVAAITRCLQFSNFTTRAYPEQIQAWLADAMAWQARTAETALLDGLSAASTQITAGQVNGASRQLVAQITKYAAYLRQRNRMDPQATLRCVLPSFVIDMSISDLVLGSQYEMEFFAQARAMVNAAYNEAGVNLSFYVDSGTGKGQLINGGAKLANGAGSTYPTTVVFYLFAEGSFLFLDGGQLDLGIVRDSTLNAQNVMRIFAESFEALAFVGRESLEVTATVVASGVGSLPAAGPASF